MKKKLGLMSLITIALITPPFGISVLIGLYYAVNGFSFMLSTSYGFDAFAAGSILWFVIIFACKLGLLAAAWILYGIVKLYKRLVNTLENNLTVTTTR